MAAGACGLQIFAVYQSVTQIIQQFSKSWSNIIANCGVTMWFASRDHQTRQTVSDLAGVTSVLTWSRGTSERRIGTWNVKPQVSDNVSQASRPLLHPDEVGRLDPGTMLLFCEGVPGVVKGVRKPYLDAYRGQYRENPYFTKGKL
jgi:type IV secretory pathway TraG/TraD family ATPase VirD4